MIFPKSLISAWGIADRFAGSRRREQRLILAGIAAGVALFLAAQGITEGLRRTFRAAILANEGAIVVKDSLLQAPGSQSAYREGVADPEKTAAIIAGFSPVAAVAAATTATGRADGGFRSRPVEAVGIEPEDFAAVVDLRAQTSDGSAALPAGGGGLLVGADLARRIETAPGKALRIAIGDRERTFRVGGIFASGLGQIDRRRIYLNRADLLDLCPEESTATHLHVALSDPGEAVWLAEEIRGVTLHDAQAWQVRERVWMDALRALETAALLLGAAVLGVAALGIFNAQAITVHQRAPEIAILRSVGYEKGDIRRIFLLQSLRTALPAVVIGVASAWAIRAGVEAIPLRVRGSATLDHLPMAFAAGDVALACSAALAFSLLASWLPATRAARLDPVTILRDKG